MRRRRQVNPNRAFTLVELLVVIGIIAIIIGLLLPVLARVAARGRDIKCQANLRSVMQAMHGYAAENKGSLPWGYVADPEPQGWWWYPLDGRPYMTWASLLARHVNGKADPVIDPADTAIHERFPRWLQCPEADQWRHHTVSYAASWIACVMPSRDGINFTDPATGGLLRPARLPQFPREAAVVWDTGIFEEWLHDPRIRLGLDIDAQRIFMGSFIAQYRFLGTRDAFGAVHPGQYGHNKPVLLTGTSTLTGPPYRNRDPGTIAQEGGTQYPYQGNLRFRHRKSTTCNVGFIDGSVRQFTAVLESDQLRVRSHDALRRYFMLKWPSGVRPNRLFAH